MYRFIHVFLLFCLITTVSAAPRGKTAKCPDFTKGDQIPGGYSHDWTLGPTGMRGWIYSNKLETREARQILITEVESGSPADGIVSTGDVILGIGNQVFKSDPRVAFGKAITQAETEAGQGKLNLLRWRDGKTTTLTIPIKVLGSYSKTAPFDCPKSAKILQLGWQALATKLKKHPTSGNTITRALNASALLASGDKQYYPLLKQQARSLSQYNQSTGVRTWQYAYANIFLAEYTIATGDKTYFKSGLERITQKIIDGQSAVGSWGHSFIDPQTKRLLGYGMMNAPGVPLTYSLVLAKQAGVDQPGLDEAITKSNDLIRFYVGKGAIPYGDHEPWIQTHDDNGKGGMAAVLFDQQGDRKAAEYFSRMSVASHGSERDMGHTGPFFNVLWALPSVARSGPHASGAWMQEFGWHFDLARRWDGTFTHQGAPDQRPDKYSRWDSTGGYLLGYAQSTRNTYLTGRKESVVTQLDPTAAKELIADGYGWSNSDRHSYYDSLSVDQLINRLSSWSPTVRERSAMALARGKHDVTSRLIGLLESSDLYSRYGACQAVKQLKKQAADAVPALSRAFQSDDLWLRILAAESLAAIGYPAKSSVPELLKRMTQVDIENDPRSMEQRYLSRALFNTRSGLIAKSLDGVDRDLLLDAVKAGLLNQDGRARGSFSSVYKNLSFEEIEPILPAIEQAIIEPAPSGIMFASEIRVSGLELFAKHRIAEGLPLCFDVLQINKWGKKTRIKRCLNALEIYGAGAKPVLPQLKQVEKDLAAHSEAKMLEPLLQQTRKLIAKLEATNQTVELRSIRK